MFKKAIVIASSVKIDNLDLADCPPPSPIKSHGVEMTEAAPFRLIIRHGFYDEPMDTVTLSRTL